MFSMFVDHNQQPDMQETLSTLAILPHRNRLRSDGWHSGQSPEVGFIDYSLCCVGSTGAHNNVVKI